MRSARVIAIDWSGARQGAARKIWLAEATSGRLRRLEQGRGRTAVADFLVAAARSDPGLVVGFDFAFSFPAWFLAAHGLTTPALWSLVEREGEAWLAACQPPFWGRPGRRRPPIAEPWRRTDRVVPAVAGIRPKSVFQIGGAGAVGTGSLRGMPILRQLRQAGFAIWPFDPPGWPRVVEIYPRLLTGPVVKAQRVAREQVLAARYPDLGSVLHDRAAASDDAFDAAIAALVMDAYADDLAELPFLNDPDLVREGVIWYPGWRSILRDA